MAGMVAVCMAPPLTAMPTVGVFAYTWITRCRTVGLGLGRQLSTMWTKAPVLGIGGRSGESIGVLASHHERYHQTAAFGKPARSNDPNDDEMCGQRPGSPK